MHHTNHAHHAQHDLTLIAGHAAGDLSGTDRVRADALLSTCTPCADLRRDLVAIAAATRSLPAPAMPARDFRLQPEQAERLRRGSWLRAALRPFSARSSAVRPIAAAFTSLGLAGLLIATVIPSLLGSAAGAPGAGREDAFQAAQASGQAGAPAPAATQGRLAPQGAQPSDDRAIVDTATGVPVLVTSGSKSTNAPAAAPTTAPTAGNEAAYAGGNPVATEAVRLQGSDSGLDASPVGNPLIAGSLGLLLVGVLLFGLRFASRRLGG